MEQIISNRAAAYAAGKYRETLPLLGERRHEIDAYVEALAGDEKVLTEFLYGTMPLCDAADYEPELMGKFVSHALFLRRNVAWTGELPEDLFFNYVLYYRVNNEDITDCRGWFYEMLMPLVEGCGQREAVKRVNYWCARQAAYTSSNARTLGPVGVFYSGSGRCGEESTFLVTALRSIGIAARQVYTPRWAHCDDNHAWVEARVDGSWCFLGACEPEEVLNKGWFTNASSRAMMVHTRVFSDYQSEGTAEDGNDAVREELTERDGAALFYNDTPFYARTERFTVEVKDENGNPVCGARVAFELLNGAEYFPVSVLVTGEDGEVSLTMGLGSVHIFVSKGELCGEVLYRNGGEGQAGGAGSCREGRTAGADHGAGVTVVLSEEAQRAAREAQKRDWQQFDLIAPRDYPVHPVTLTGEQKERGRAGRQEAELLRKQKLKRYADPESYAAYQDIFAAAERDERLREILALSYGNTPEICRFLERHPEGEAVSFLGVLDKKDYRDLRADVLEEHYNRRKELYDAFCGNGGVEQEDGLFLRYVWNPRIRYEALTPYRAAIQKALNKEQEERFRSEPGAIWRWIQETVSCEPGRSYHPVVTSPAGVLRTGQGSELSQKTLFVAICRTLGIPARINPVTSAAEYYRDHGFVAVGCLDAPDRNGRAPESAGGGDGSHENTATGGNDDRRVRLILRSGDEPAYFVSWTIGRQTVAGKGADRDGYTAYETLDFSDRAFEDGTLTLLLPEGCYRLLTTVRLPNGNQMAAVRIFDTADCVPGTDGVPEAELSLLLRRPLLAQMTESLALEDFTLRLEDGTECESREIVDRHTMLAFLEEGTEPTEHLLNELREQRQEFLESGLKLIFVLTGRGALSNPTLADAMEKLPAEVYYDDFAELPEVLARRMYTDPEKLPLVLLVSPAGGTACEPGKTESAAKLTGRYASSGYNVGNVRMMLGIAKLLEA